MSKKSNALTQPPEGYTNWLADLKTRIHCAQQRSAIAVNHELVKLYWQIGTDILSRQKEQGWGSKVIERLSHDLRTAFPDMKGFSRSNLMYMRSFAEAWADEQIVQQPVGQLPWGHNLVLLTKLKNPEERMTYAQKTIENGWSRNVLIMQIESGLLERQGSAVTNFERNLPKPQSDLARESLKDPYRFDFLGLGEEAQEREIEKALTQHVTEFLLELGAGFAFVGRQKHVEVGGEDFYIDLLFYHLKLRCYVVVELKAGDFKPEQLGQLGFYLTAVNRQLKDDLDQPSIGLLLCKSKNKVVAEYALSDKSQPMGIAEYKLQQSLPETLETSLPSIEQIERELQGDNIKTMGLQNIVIEMTQRFAFVQKNDVDPLIQEYLEKVGNELGADRGGLIVFNHQKTNMTWLVEWEGKGQAYKDSCRRRKTDQFPWMMELFARQQGFNFNLPNWPDGAQAEREMFEKWSSTTVICQPIIENELKGFVFWGRGEAASWGRNEELGISQVAKIFGIGLKRR